MTVQLLTRSSGRAAAATQPRRAGSRGRRKALTAWLFMVPLLVVNALVIVAPAIESVYYSFTNWTGIGGAKFTGLTNYRMMFTSGAFWDAMLHNVLWTAFFLIVPISMGLAGAFMLSRIRRFQMVFRVVYFIPYILATIISAVVWENLLSPTNGIGVGLSSWGLHAFANVNFLGDPHLALPSVAFNRKVGAFAGIEASPGGEKLSADEWERHKGQWLPTDVDKTHVRSLMQPVHERGKIAAWIAPPRNGINGKPFDYDYVRLP